MQSVFLSFTYNPHPDHVAETEDLRRRVSTVIESMDLRVVTGEDLGGEALSDEIRTRIEKCDALVALVTPWRDRLGQKVEPPWVRDEFNHAKAMKKRAFRIAHPDYAGGGMYAAHEYTTYTQDTLADVLVKLIKTLSLWRRASGRPLRIEIAPGGGQQFPRVAKPDCRYKLLRDYQETDWFKASVWPQPGALYAFVPGVPDDAKLMLQLKLDNETWESDFQDPIGRVQMTRQP